MRYLFLAITLFFALNSFAQEKPDIEIDKPEFKSDVVKFNPGANTMEFLGNVAFKSKKMNFDDADKVVLDLETNEIVATGWTRFSFVGPIYAPAESEDKILRYIIGDDMAYLE